MEKKLQKIYLTYYDLLIAQDLWQAHYQILSIFFLKEFIELKVNTDMMIKKRQTCGIKYKYCDCFPEYMNFKDDLIEYKCLCCNKNYKHRFDKKLEERFFITYKFSNHHSNNIINNNINIDNIIILIYPYEYMDDWEKFNETSLPEKENFYNHLNKSNHMEDVTDSDLVHTKRVCQDFKIKNLG